MHFPSLTHMLAATATLNETRVMVWSSFLNSLCKCWEWIDWFSLTTRQSIQSCQETKYVFVGDIIQHATERESLVAVLKAGITIFV